MLTHVIRPFRGVAHALLASDSPQQLAAGFALGMVLGLMPKGNLIALSLLVLLFSIRVNAGLGLVAAIAFWRLSTVVDPFADKLGLLVLSMDSLQATYASVFSLPLGPWIGFNNTVVIGSLLIGLYFTYPVYWMCLVVCRRLQPKAMAPAGTNGRDPMRHRADEPIERRAA